MEEKLKYCVKGKDTFVWYAESPVGTYYLNNDKKLVIFIASGNMSNEDAYEIDDFMAIVGMASRIENARKIKYIHDNFVRLEVDEPIGPETPVTYEISGELRLTSFGKTGKFYVDTENKRWYFEPTIKTLRNKLFNLFKEGVTRDAKISPEIVSILIILKNWKEIREDEIISD